MVGSLWIALVNQPGAGVSAEQITCWLEVLESVVDRPPGVEESVTLVDRLEAVGFDPDPPGIEGLLGVLLTLRKNQALGIEQ